MAHSTWSQVYESKAGIAAIDARLQAIHDSHFAGSGEDTPHFQEALFADLPSTYEQHPHFQSVKGVCGTPHTSSPVHTKNYLVVRDDGGLTMPAIAGQLWQEVPFEHAPRDEYRRQPPTEAEETFRHSGWQHDRREILKSLMRARQSATRIDSFATCGSYAQVQANPQTGQMRVVGNYCHDRLCRPCARARAAEAIRTIRSRLTRDRVRFVTLTLKHSDTPLRDQITRLRTCFKELRHTKFWKAAVSGGVVAMEVKLTTDGQWHPHLHVITEGTWIDQIQLSALWYGITGDSHIVDVRSPASDKAVAEVATYLTKYISKPAGLNMLTQPEKLDEYVVAMKGVHVIDYLGEWRGLKADADAEMEQQQSAWVPIGSVEFLWRRAVNGDPIARGILFGVESEVYSRYRANLFGSKVKLPPSHPARSAGDRVKA